LSAGLRFSNCFNSNQIGCLWVVECAVSSGSCLKDAMDSPAVKMPDLVVLAGSKTGGAGLKVFLVRVNPRFNSALRQTPSGSRQLATVSNLTLVGRNKMRNGVSAVKELCKFNG